MCIRDSHLTSTIWSPTNETTSSILVQPSTTSTYTVDVTSGSTTCQSDVTISVNQRDFVTVDSTACTSIEWKGSTILTSGTYYDTLQNAVGCDSIVTLNLTINQTSLILDTHEACDTFTWIDGNTYTADNSSATYTLTNAAGCDSVVVLDLTIHTSPTVSLGNDTTICDGNTLTLDAGSGYNYLWSDASTGQTLDVTTFGNYDVTISDNNNCTATDQINVLFETPTVFAGNDQTVCDGDSVTLTADSTGTICATVVAVSYTHLTLPTKA